MKLSMQLAVAAVSLSLMGGSVANADTILQYTFDTGSFYNLSGISNNTVSGSFTYDATTQVLSDVNYDRGGEIFTVGSVTGPGAGPNQLFFGDTTSSDYDVYQFQNSLALGGTDTIIAGYHPDVVVSAGGSVSAGLASPAPEPASWALMLTGFGLVGYAMRTRKFAASIRRAQ